MTNHPNLSEAESQMVAEAKQIRETREEINDTLSRIRELEYSILIGYETQSEMKYNPYKNGDKKSMSRTSIKVNPGQKAFADSLYPKIDVDNREYFYGLCVAFAQKYPTLFTSFTRELRQEAGIISDMPDKVESDEDTPDSNEEVDVSMEELDKV